MSDPKIAWTVELSHKVKKQRENLPDRVRSIFDYLLRQIELSGPIQREWKNFGALGEDVYHCHIKKGKPTYVAVWTVNKKIKFIEVTYVGTHEKAPY